ncbi:MAG: ABC transporter substrate-binding protein [Hyphomicrobiaceae bacterium]
MKPQSSDALLVRNVSAVTRRETIGGSAALFAATTLPGKVRAQPKEIVVGGAASHKPWMDSQIIPAFEKKYGSKIIFEGGRSSINLQKMQTNKLQPTLSVVMMDDPFLITAMEEGLIEKLDSKGIANLTKIRNSAIHFDGAWANYLQPWAGIAFNSEKVPGGVASWEALWDPKFRGRVAIPSLQNTDGVFTLFMASHLATGKPVPDSSKDIDAAFKKLAELKPNLLTVYTNLPQTSNLLEQGEAHLMVSFSSYVLLRKQQNTPIDLAAPKEGIFPMPSGIALVKGGPQRELAQAFINEMLGAEFQSKIAPLTFSLPTHPDAKSPPGMPSNVAVHPIDWGWVGKNRADLIARWDKTMAL